MNILFIICVVRVLANGLYRLHRVKPYQSRAPWGSVDFYHTKAMA